MASYTASLTASWNGTGTAPAGSNVVIPTSLPYGWTPAASVGLNLTGTWVGTVVFDGTEDGTNWFQLPAYPLLAIGLYGGPVVSVAANGQYAIPVHGLTQVRVRCSAFTSGTIGVGVDSATAAPVMQVFANTEGQKPTYSIAGVGLVPLVGDFLIIQGSATKTVRMTRMKFSGVASSNGVYDLTAVERGSAATGGTLGTAPTIVKNDPNDPTATATVSLYTVAPTVGSLTGIFDADKHVLPGSGTGLQAPLVWDFGTRPARTAVLRGTSQFMALNGAGTIPAGALVNYKIEWTEEA